MRVLLVNESDQERESLAERLRAQGYQVDVAPDAATAADMALEAPPDGVVADLWMRSISGVPLCRLLRSEPATNEVPVVLRAEDEPRNRFWAERAGAAFVRKGRVGELVRTLARELRELKGCDGLVKLNVGDMDIRDRIAHHLDAALFDSVLASEVRALAHTGTFDRLFDHLSQFVAQVTSYRWLALASYVPERIGVHAHPHLSLACVEEARTLLGMSGSVPVIRIEDEDAAAEPGGEPPIVREIRFGSELIGSVALVPLTAKRDEDLHLLDVISNELGGPLRMTTLVEESQRMATTDPLTGLLNRRAFLEDVSRHLPPHSDRPLSLLLFDIDHFKKINDTRGHAGGDLALVSVGQMLRRFIREHDIVARWGGEEFVVALPNTHRKQGLEIAERLRHTLEHLEIREANGQRISITASVGLAVRRSDDHSDQLVARADQAMYLAKTEGRNRVVDDLRLTPSSDESHPLPAAS